MVINAELDRKANAIARQLTGEVGWRTVLLGVFSIAVYCTGLIGAITGSLSLWLGFILCAISSYSVYTVMHDAVHGAIQGKNKKLRWLNDLMGYLAGQILFTSFKVHQKEHLAHHRNTNKEGEDPDLFVNSDNPLMIILGALKVLYLQNKFYFTTIWPTAPKSEKGVILLEVLLFVSWRVAVFALGFWQEGLLVMVLGNLVGILVLLILFAWAVHRPYKETERYLNTSAYIFPSWINGLVTWAWLFQNYHAVHHLFPRVPFYRYKAVFDQIEPIMQAHQAPIYRIGH